MRLAEIPGLSGPSTVAVIHSSESVEALEEFLELSGIEARAVEAPDWVQIGTAYDGTAFAQPSPAPEPEPIPLLLVEPEPWVEPAPIPPTLEQVRSQLDSLREQTTAEYVARWGDLSKRELWPLLDAEMVRAVGETAETINPDRYPAIVGFLAASEQPTVGAAVYAAAATLRQHKSHHVGHLRLSELLRERLLIEYDDLPDPEKLTWDAATAWAEGVAAWD
jgi:hypothetical protein